jgi:hypothetical protein
MYIGAWQEYNIHKNQQHKQPRGRGTDNSRALLDESIKSEIAAQIEQALANSLDQRTAKVALTAIRSSLSGAVLEDNNDPRGCRKALRLLRR